MDRREFFSRGAVLAAGAALAAVEGLSPRRAFAEAASSFSIDVVTDRPDLAIQGLEGLIRSTALKQPFVRFTESPLVGQHTGDIAYVRSRQLVDFRRTGGRFCGGLRDVAVRLDIPRPLTDPVLLRFSNVEPGLSPAEAAVYSGEGLVARLSLKGPRQVRRVETARGHVDVACGDGSAEVLAATCRHQTCVKMGAISRPGQSLVCIPNQVTVAIAGRSPLGVDAVTS